MTAERESVADNYRLAAGERLISAEELYNNDRYVEACYFAGLAVECILRGYRARIVPEFDARHDLHRLADLAKFGDAVPPAQGDEIKAAMEEVVSLWSNNYRYWPLAQLKREWLRKQFERRAGKHIKGDFVKERARQICAAAAKIVNAGVARWQISIKS